MVIRGWCLGCAAIGSTGDRVPFHFTANEFSNFKYDCWRPPPRVCLILILPCYHLVSLESTSPKQNIKSIMSSPDAAALDGQMISMDQLARLLPLLQPGATVQAAPPAQSPQSSRKKNKKQKAKETTEDGEDVEAAEEAEEDDGTPVGMLAEW